MSNYINNIKYYFKHTTHEQRCADFNKLMDNNFTPSFKKEISELLLHIVRETGKNEIFEDKKSTP